MTIIETYNGALVEMRRSGSTLAEIGNAVGVTRERIRQILNEYYPGTQMSCLNESQLAKVIGCSSQCLVKLRRAGILKPRHTSGLYVYDKDEVERAMLVTQKFCIHCGEPVPKYNKTSCERCSAERRQNPWKFRSEEGKKRCTEANRNWQRDHPERWKEISDKAMQKYCLKRRQEHVANTEYIVVKGNTRPIGSLFKAVGFKNWHLILADGNRIPVNNIRKITAGA